MARTACPTGGPLHHGIGPGSIHEVHLERPGDPLRIAVGQLDDLTIQH
jgi:hypothetical protein